MVHDVRRCRNPKEQKRNFYHREKLKTYMQFFLSLFQLPKQNGRLTKQNGRLLDVMFWIHGGGFFLGSAKDYPPQYLMDKNVVYVSANYRLGVLGTPCYKT
jgi:acetyl esterase/lipase